MRASLAWTIVVVVGCAQGSGESSSNGDASDDAVVEVGPFDATSTHDTISGADGPIFDAVDDVPCASGSSVACTTSCGTAGHASCDPKSGSFGACKPDSSSDPCTGLDCTGKGDGVEHTYFRDADGDGHGDAKTSIESCAPPPAGYVSSSDDCDDAHAQVHPGAPEICDKLDDDCDGGVDEGLHVAIFDVAYTDVAPCSPSADHAACKIAAHDFCVAKDPACYDGGYGPVELGASDGQFVCISGATLTGTWAEVPAAQPACSDDSMAGLRVCESAVHRAAAIEGFASGMLQRHSPGDWKWIGLDPSRAHVYGSVAWSEITGYHSGCTLARVDTFDCNAAVERDCLARGHAAGFGPVEYNGTDVAFVCVDK